MKLQFYFKTSPMILLKLNKTKLFFTLALTFVLFQLNLYAQSDQLISEIKWGKNQKTSIFYDNMKILYHDDNSVYFFKNLPEAKPITGFPSLYELLVKYDRKQDSIYYINLELKTEDVNRSRASILLIDSTIHIISYFNNKSKNAVYIFDETIDMENFKLNNDIHKISEFKYENAQIISNDIFVTLEKETYLEENMLSLKYDCRTNKGVLHGFELLNSKFESITKYQNLTNSNTAIPNYIFDKEYNLYFIERVYNKNSSFFNLRLLYYQKVDSALSMQDLVIENQFITEQTLAINDKNQLICSGLYSSKFLTNAIGAFTIIYSTKLQDTGLLHKVNFDYDFLSKGMNEKDAISLKKDLEKGKNSDYTYRYFFQNTHFKKDGCFDLVIEKKIKDFYPSSGGGGHYVYRYSDLYVLDFNSDGSSNWIQKIYRNETFHNQFTSSHLLGDCYINFKNDDIIFIYNKFNFENIDRSEGSSFKNGKTYLTSIDSNGNKNDKILIGDPEICKSLCPKISFNYNDNCYFLTKTNDLSSTSFFQAVNSKLHSFNLGTISLK